MRRLPLAALAVLALAPSSADAAANASAAAVVLERVGVSGRAVAGLCSWDGAVLSGFATSVPLPPDAALDIVIKCTLYDRYGNVLGQVHAADAGPPVADAAVFVPTNQPGLLCGSVNAYFRSGALTDSGCATPAP